MKTVRSNSEVELYEKFREDFCSLVLEDPFNYSFRDGYKDVTEKNQWLEHLLRKSRTVEDTFIHHVIHDVVLSGREKLLKSLCEVVLNEKVCENIDSKLLEDWASIISTMGDISLATHTYKSFVYGPSKERSVEESYLLPFEKRIREDLDHRFHRRYLHFSRNSKIPEEVFLEILQFVEHDTKNLLTVGSVSMDWNEAFIRTFDTITIDTITLYEIPLSVFRGGYCRKVKFVGIRSFSLSDLKYFNSFFNPRSFEVLELETLPADHSSYLYQCGVVGETIPLHWIFRFLDDSEAFNSVKTFLMNDPELLEFPDPEVPYVMFPIMKIFPNLSKFHSSPKRRKKLNKKWFFDVFSSTSSLQSTFLHGVIPRKNFLKPNGEFQVFPLLTTVSLSLGDKEHVKILKCFPNLRSLDILVPQPGPFDVVYNRREMTERFLDTNNCDHHFDCVSFTNLETLRIDGYRTVKLSGTCTLPNLSVLRIPCVNSLVDGLLFEGILSILEFRTGKSSMVVQATELFSRRRISEKLIIHRPWSEVGGKHRYTDHALVLDSQGESKESGIGMKGLGILRLFTDSAKECPVVHNLELIVHSLRKDVNMICIEELKGTCITSRMKEFTEVMNKQGWKELIVRTPNMVEGGRWYVRF